MTLLTELQNLSLFILELYVHGNIHICFCVQPTDFYIYLLRDLRNWYITFIMCIKKKMACFRYFHRGEEEAGISRESPTLLLHFIIYSFKRLLLTYLAVYTKKTPANLQFSFCPSKPKPSCVILDNQLWKAVFSVSHFPWFIYSHVTTIYKAHVYNIEKGLH